jgi:hypothetical protein
VWVNEHLVYRIAGVEWYALVLFETFAVTAVLAFAQVLTAIGAELGKRATPSSGRDAAVHPAQLLGCAR